MEDLIRRQDAANLLYKMLADDYVDGYAYLKQLRALPSAEPERKKGRWIYDTERVTTDGLVLSQYHCSECGLQSVSRMNFCGYCGADMRGE